MAAHDSASIPINASHVHVGLAWDFFQGKQVDVDVSAVLYDAIGGLIDACYYNQKDVCSGAIVHSGDDTTGDGDGDDESLRLALSALPMSIAHIVLLITCHDAGTSFEDVETAHVHIDEVGAGTLATFALGGMGPNTAAVLCRLSRDGSGWVAAKADFPGSGNNFMEASPLMEKYLATIIDPVLLAEGQTRDRKKRFDMKKGETYILDPCVNVIKMGLGWDSHCDLDGSCLTYDCDFNNMDVVSFKQLTATGIVHSGDNTTGVGDGDDEVITVNLRELPTEVVYLFFTVCIYSTGSTFAQVDGEYARMFTKEGELMKYYMEAKAIKDCTAVTMCMMSRHENSWKMKTLSEGGHAAVCEKLVEPLREYLILNAVKGIKALTYSVAVQSGQDLLSMDRNGLSDPYCLFGIGSVHERTSVEKKTLAPTFTGPPLIFQYFGCMPTLNFKVFDWDRFSKDDPMGEGTINVRGPGVCTVPLILQGKPAGSLTVEVLCF